MNDKLISVLADVFGMRPDQITLELTKDDVECWDSLRQMDLVMSIEREFDIALEMQEIVSMNSVANIKSVLAGKGIDFGD